MFERPLRVLHIITGLTVGGAQQLLLETLTGMQARGLDIQVVGLYPGSMAPEFTARGIPVRELSLRGLIHLPTLRRLVRIIRNLKPDVVHTHLGKADTYGRVAARLAGVPVIITTAHNVEDWKANPALRVIDGLSSRFAARIVACSERVARHIREIGYADPAKVVTVSNGIAIGAWAEMTPDERDARRAEFGFAPDDYVIGSVGRLEEQKAHEFLLAAVARMNAAGAVGVKVLLIGDGPLCEALHRQAEGLGIARQVVFAGLRRDARRLYPIFDLFALPSRWEGLPIALLEAMAAARPIVATPVGGIPEVIRDGQEGLLVPPEDAPALADALLRCYHDRDFATQLATQTRQRVIANFSIDATVDKLVALYRELLAMKR